jgi:hypothetical protein
MKILITYLGGCGHDDGETEDLAELGMGIDCVTVLNRIVVSSQTEQAFLYVENDEGLLRKLVE